MYEKELDTFRNYLTRKRFRDETVKTYARAVRQFLPYIGKEVKNLTKKDLDKFEGYCKKYDNNSLTAVYSAINKYIQHLREDGILDITRDELEDMKLKPPQMESRVKHPMTKEQVERVFEIASINPMHLAIFMTFYYGMLRRSEICSLNLEDIHFEKKKLDILDAKGGRNAQINIHPRCLEALKDYIYNYREEPRKEHEKAVFLYDGRRLSKTKLFQINKTYKYKAGFPDDFKFHTHIWRITGITHFAMKEKDIKKLMAQTRHKDTGVLMGYINYTDKEITDAYMEAFDNPTPKKPDITPTPEPKPKAKPKDDEVMIQKPSIPEPTPQQDIMIQTPNNGNLKQQLTERFIKGEITESGYLVALKSLDNKDNMPIGYQ